MIVGDLSLSPINMMLCPPQHVQPGNVSAITAVSLRQS
jgi:hypothetical protein